MEICSKPRLRLGILAFVKINPNQGANLWSAYCHLFIKPQVYKECLRFVILVQTVKGYEAKAYIGPGNFFQED